jgi:hypothetical protein
VLPLEVLVGLVLLAGLALLVISLRRRWLGREGGSIEMSWRLVTKSQGRGWVLGTGRYVGDQLHWFRVFSLSTRPRRTLQRGRARVVRRRAPSGPEALALIKGMEVVELEVDGRRVEIGLDPSAVTGLLAWLEASPPGATLPA